MCPEVTQDTTTYMSLTRTLSHGHLYCKEDWKRNFFPDGSMPSHKLELLLLKGKWRMEIGKKFVVSAISTNRVLDQKDLSPHDSSSRDTTSNLGKMLSFFGPQHPNLYLGEGNRSEKPLKSLLALSFPGS